MRQFIQIVENLDSDTPVTRMLRDLQSHGQDYLGSYKIKIGPTDILISVQGTETAELDNIETPPDLRREGHGSKALRTVLAAADKHGVTMELGVWAGGDDDDGGLDNSALRAWYGRFGFRNSGRLDSIDEPIYERKPMSSLREFFNIVEHADTDILSALAKRLKAAGFDDVALVPEQWLVHFSYDAEAICGEGFTKGTPLNHHAWKGTFGRAYDKPGFNFAVEATDEESIEFWSHHSFDAVVFRAAGVRCWHKDGFDQVIFEGPTAKHRHYLSADIEEHEGYESPVDEADYAVKAVDGRPVDGPRGGFWTVLAAIMNGNA